MRVQPYEMSAEELRRAYSRRTLSPVETMMSVLRRVETHNPTLNALIFVDPDQALAEARASEDRWRRGQPVGLLDGIPVTIKDSIAERTRPMLRGLKANIGKPPVGYDAPPAARVREAGGIVFAKTTMPDFGLLMSGVSSAFGVTRNPWDTTRNPGGSSSGAAAALAARCGPLALGTDVGGSVRLPAALCGVVGMKPTGGRVPHLPPSLTRVAGPMARDVADAALLLDVLRLPDARDYVALPHEDILYYRNLVRDMRGVRIGLLAEGDTGRPAAPAVRAAVEGAGRIFETAGATVTRVEPVVDHADMDAIRVTLLLRGASEYRQIHDRMPQSIPGVFLSAFESLAGMDGFAIGAALDRVETIRSRIQSMFEPYDYFLSPTLAVAGFAAETLDPTPADGTGILNTPVWNITGHPALSICCGFDGESRLPIGLQIVGRRYDDLGVLQMAAAFERDREPLPRWPD